MKKLLFLLIGLFCGIGAFARQEAPIMDDTFRSSGKIYVVITIIAIIFIGLAFYLFSMDRRLRKIEKFEKN